MDLLERFPRAWCDTCQKVQLVILDVMKADDKNDHDAATSFAKSASQSW